MLVFIDDSGDPGFKINKGSTRFFVIALVIFNDDLEAEKAAVCIKDLKRRLGFPDDLEFKFNKSSRKTRESFLRTVNNFDFKVRSIVFDKAKIKSTELKNKKNSFYSYAIKMVLKYSRNFIIQAKVKIDGSGDRVFRKSFLTYLRRELSLIEKPILKHCKIVDSKGNVLVQMADMIAGAIRRSHDDCRGDSKIYKAIIQKHIQDEWQFR